MVANSRLVVYGNSVFLAGIKAQLEHAPELELITMDATPPDVVDWVHACQPQVVLFDLTMGYPDFAIALLHELPGLLLIGVDPNSDELLVLACQQERAVAVADLLRVIQREEMGGKEDAGTRRQGDAGVVKPIKGFEI
jgi:hypothetical protein